MVTTNPSRQQGADAKALNLDESACPYDADSVEGKAWLSGFKGGKELKDVPAYSNADIGQFEPEPSEKANMFKSPEQIQREIQSGEYEDGTPLAGAKPTTPQGVKEALKSGADFSGDKAGDVKADKKAK